MKKKDNQINSNYSLLYFLFAVLLLYSSVAWAQKTDPNNKRRTVIGRVISADNKKPVTGAAIRVKGLPINTTTNGKGRYSICVPDDSLMSLIFYYKGMQTQEISLNSKSSVNVAIRGIDFSPYTFHIMPDMHLNRFNDQENGLRGLSECHFTVANTANPQNIALCEELGLAVIISEVPHLGKTDWLKFSDNEIDQTIKRMVENGGDSKAIIGYYLVDEPHASSFPALAKAVAAVKKYAPGKLAYINLYPQHGTIMADGQLKSLLGTNSYTEYLERYVNEVKPQFICYDNYRVQYSQDLKNMDLGSGYFYNLLEVRRIALKYDLPFFNIVSSNQIRPHTPVPSPANMLLQAYTTIAAGARGIQWYTYHPHRYQYTPLDMSENKTLTWRYLEEVNRQLSVLGPVMQTLKSTGVYFTSPAIADSLPLLPGKLVQELDSEAPMMVGEFVNDKQEKFIMVVNLSLEKSAKFFLKTNIPQEEILMVSAAEDYADLIPLNIITRPDMGSNGGYWLVAGQGVLLKATGHSQQE